MSELSIKEKRWLLFECLVKLHAEMKAKGFHPALGEGQDMVTKKDPTTDHMKNSLHEIGLAQDILLYTKLGDYLDRTEHHKQFGEFWETLDPLCAWGGRWGDGNHYSIKHGGRK